MNEPPSAAWAISASKVSSTSRGGESQLRISQPRTAGCGESSPASVSISDMAFSPSRLRYFSIEAGGQGGGSVNQLAGRLGRARSLQGAPRPPRARPGRRPASRPASRRPAIRSPGQPHVVTAGLERARLAASRSETQNSAPSRIAGDSDPAPSGQGNRRSRTSAWPRPVHLRASRCAVHARRRRPAGHSPPPSTRLELCMAQPARAYPEDRQLPGQCRRVTHQRADPPSPAEPSSCQLLQLEHGPEQNIRRVRRVTARCRRRARAPAIPADRFVTGSSFDATHC